MEFFLIILTSILASCIALVIWYFLAKEFYTIAQEKGYNNKKYWWLTFIFGLYGCLLVVALPDRANIKKDKMSHTTSKTIEPISSTPLVKHNEVDDKNVIFCTYCNTANPKGTKICKKCNKRIL